MLKHAQGMYVFPDINVSGNFLVPATAQTTLQVNDWLQDSNFKNVLQTVITKIPDFSSSDLLMVPLIRTYVIEVIILINNPD